MIKNSFVIIILLTGISIHSQQINNNYFTVSFDKKTGYLSATTSKGEESFRGAVNAIFPEGNLYLASAGNYRFKARQLTEGNGIRVLEINGTDRKNELDFVQRVTLFDQHPAIGFEVIYKNVSGQEINVRSLEPLRLINQNGGGIFFNPSEKCLTNGAMYYDAGNIQDLSKPWIKPEPYGETKGGVISDTVITSNPLTVQSWWNISVFSDLQNETLTAGYLLNANSLGRVQILKNDNNQLSLVAESVLNHGFVLKPGKSISSDQFIIVTGKNIFEANQLYADLMKEKMNNPICTAVNGWCNWFYTLDAFGEIEILENAAFAAKYLKPFGMEYIQIDEGFQTTHGNWQGNQQFPHGLKWLCDSISHLGLKPGIWISPFVISENSEVYKNHPEWLLKNENGELKRIGPWPSENTDWFRNETPKRYCLDITHPGAEKWYKNLVDTIVNNWGFKMIKVDFVAWTVFSAERFYDPTATPAQVYRHALEMMRTVAGTDCHILDCGPGHVSGGYINSLRIEYDQNYGNADNAWTQYFRGNSCSAGAAGKRWYFHNKIWSNDIDHLCMDLLSDNEAKAAATLIGLSGGNVMSGDRLMNLTPEKLSILEKIFPSTSENAIPVDLTENDPPTIFTSKIKRPFGEWQLVAFFNPDREKPVQKTIRIEQLMPEKSQVYLAFDFWNQRFVGEIKDTLKVNVNPASTVLLSLHIKKGIPQVIGTSRHVKMGAVEISKESYDETTKTLIVKSLAPAGTSHSVFVYLPDGYGWQSKNGKIYEYNPNYSIRQTEPNLVRVDLKFDETGQVNWQLKFFFY
ncbi:MAG: glycoside hydrolase family 36 protein [Bacteroidales bacterium]